MLNLSEYSIVLVLDKNDANTYCKKYINYLRQPGNYNILLLVCFMGYLKWPVSWVASRQEFVTWIVC